MDKKIEIGKRIKEHRKAAGMTQKELAEKVGCAEITIRQYESGKYLPKTDARLKIANALEVFYGDLFVDQTPMAFDTPEDFEKAWREKAREVKEDNVPVVESTLYADGTTTNELHYHDEVHSYSFEKHDLSEREYNVFESMYSLLRSKDSGSRT